MAHWNEYNRFSGELVHVPLEELARCCAGGSVGLPNGDVVAYDEAFVLAEWQAAGDRLDGYILPWEDGRYSIGIRYGSEDADYLSPSIKNLGLVRELHARHSAATGVTPSP